MFGYSTSLSRSCDQPSNSSTVGGRCERLVIKIMAPFPYLPMLAIMASLVSQEVVQMSVYAYAAFMVEHLGVVNDSDESGRSGSMQIGLLHLGL